MWKYKTGNDIHVELLTHFPVHTNGKKKSEGSLALMVGGALNPGLADCDTSMKLTELMTETTPPPVEGDGWENKQYQEKIC